MIYYIRTIGRRCAHAQTQERIIVFPPPTPRGTHTHTNIYIILYIVIYNTRIHGT